MPLILRIGRVTEPLLEDVIHVVKRAHQRRVIGDVEDVEPVAIARRIACTRSSASSSLISAAVSPNTDRTDSATTASASETRSAGATIVRPAVRRIPPRNSRRRGADAGTRLPARPRRRIGARPTFSKKYGSHSLTRRTISEITRLRLVGGVARVHHPMQPVQDDARHGVDHGRERGNRDDVARGLDRALLGVLLDLFQPLGIRVGADVAQLLQDGQRIVLEQRRQLRVTIPCANDRCFEHVASPARERRHVRPRLFELYVTLAGLLGVVERIRVQERPDELPRDVLEAELEVRVLVDRVVPGVEREQANRIALGFGDFIRANHPRRIAGPSGRDGAIVRRGGRRTERDDRWARGQHWRGNYRALKIIDF